MLETKGIAVHHLYYYILQNKKQKRNKLVNAILLFSLDLTAISNLNSGVCTERFSKLKGWMINGFHLEA